MNKNDLKLISAFIDTKNPKAELNFAHLKEDGIYATDTRKLIKFCVPMLGLDLLLEKRILNGFVSTLGKDDFVSIDGFGFIRTGSVKMNCDTFSYDEAKPFDFAECNGFYISYNQQKETVENDVKTKHNGIVKIVGRYSTEDESNLVKFIAVVMGRTFESKAIEE